MKLNKDNIKEEDKELAISLYNYLRQGNRVIGNPAQGLKETLKQLEDTPDKKFEITDWLMDDTTKKEAIAKLKAGIKGEEQLSEYLTVLLKNAKELDGIVAFASLSYEQENNTKDYIPDSDFVVLYGNNLLVIDAKNLSTKPDMTLYLDEGVILTDKGKELLEVKSSCHIWNKLLPNLDSIDGYVCIVNKTGCEIYRNEEWYSCQYKLIHISELYNILLDWIKECNNDICNLSDLVTIAKTQIRKEKSDLDLSIMKKTFGV